MRKGSASKPWRIVFRLRCAAPVVKRLATSLHEDEADVLRQKMDYSSSGKILGERDLPKLASMCGRRNQPLFPRGSPDESIPEGEASCGLG